MSDEPRRDHPDPPPNVGPGIPATAPIPQAAPSPQTAPNPQIAPTEGPPPLPPPLPPAGYQGQGWAQPGWNQQGYAQQWSTPDSGHGYPHGAYGASTQQGPWPPPSQGGPYPYPGAFPDQGGPGGPPPAGAWGAPQPTRRNRRTVLALVGGIAAALLLVALAGWYFFGRQSASATCNAQTGSCELTLVHRGATVNLTTVGGVKVVTQQGIDGGQASYSVDGTTKTCRQGESARVANLGITCSRVDGDTLVLTVRN